MKSLLALCFSIGFFVNSFGQNIDDRCKNDLKNFLACATNSISDNDRQARMKELEDKRTQCFRQAGCDPPNWDADPLGGHEMSLPESVKKCVQQKIMNKVGDQLNECLAKRNNIRIVDYIAFSDSAEAGTYATSIGSVRGSLSKKQGIVGIFNAVTGVDKCCQTKKGGDTNAVQPLEQCLHNVKKEVKPKLCVALKPCEDKISPPCKSRSQEIRKAVCLCKKEKEREIAGRLKVLGQQPKVSINDVANTLADRQDVNEVIDYIDQCYHEQNEPESATLKLAMNTMRSGRGRGVAMMNGSAVIIMSDMLTLDANDQSECDNCP